MVRLGVIALAFFLSFSTAHATDFCAEVGKAIKTGDNKSLSKLLKADPELVKCDRNEPTPALLGAMYGNVETMRILVSFGVDTNARYRMIVNGYVLYSYPIILAAQSNSADVVNFLLSLGADPNSVDWDKESALLKAIQNKKVLSAEALLAAGANPNLENKYGARMANIAAIETGDLSLVALLFANGGDFVTPSSNREVALSSAIRKLNLPLVQLLESYGADIFAPDRRGYTPLLESVMVSFDDGVKYLLDKGADPKYETPAPASGNLVSLSSTNYRMNFKYVKWAVEHGMPIDWKSKEGRGIVAEFYSTLINGVYPKHEAEIIELNDWLRAKGYDFNALDSQGRRPIYYLMLSGITLPIIQSVERNGGYVGCAPTTSDRENMLHTFVTRSYEAGGMDVLLNLGCRIDAQAPKTGNTALHFAALRGNTSMAKELLARGANPNIFNNNGNSPLHAMVASSQLTSQVNTIPIFMEALTKNKFDVNSLNASGDAPFHIIVKTLARGVAKDVYLNPMVEAGLDINKSNKAGIKPLKLAKILNLPQDQIDALVRNGATD